MKLVQAYTEGHPDKICDQIADAIVDEYLRRDPESHADISVMGSHGMLVIGGSAASKADFDTAELAKQVYRKIGYLDDLAPFVNIETLEEKKHPAKGAYGTIFVNGYATNETREFLPRPVVLAHEFVKRLDELRKSDPQFSWLKPDGKIQLAWDAGRVKALTILLQHSDTIDHTVLKQLLLDRVAAPFLGDTENVSLSINPLGCYSEGGLGHDTGANNRKAFADTYGGLVPFGSIGLSGKCPGRIERPAAYMARFVAKRFASEGKAKQVFVKLAYTLGGQEPMMIEVVGDGGVNLTDEARSRFDFRPEAIVERFDLRKPIYRMTSVYGHFGRPQFPWENVDSK